MPRVLSERAQDAQINHAVCVAEVAGAHAEVQGTGIFTSDPLKPQVHFLEQCGTLYGLLVVLRWQRSNCAPRTEHDNAKTYGNTCPGWSKSTRGKKTVKARPGTRTNIAKHDEDEPMKFVIFGNIREAKSEGMEVGKQVHEGYRICFLILREKIILFT